MRNLLLVIGLIGLVSCANMAGSDVEKRNQGIVKQIYADFASGNMQGFTAALDADIVWNEADNNVYAVGNPYIGVESVMNDMMSHTEKDWTSFEVVPESYMTDGDEVAMFGRYQATSAATGKSMNPQVVHRWTLQNGKIVAFQQHLDTLAQHQALTPGGAAYAKAVEKEALHEYLAAINSNDLEAIMDKLTDDVVFQAPHGPELVGKEAVREWAADYLGAFQINWQKTALDFTISDDWAFERYAYKSTDTDRKTGEVFKDEGKGLNIYNRGPDGKWRVARDTWSTDLPLPQ